MRYNNYSRPPPPNITQYNKISWLRFPYGYTPKISNTRSPFLPKLSPINLTDIGLHVKLIGCISLCTLKYVCYPLMPMGKVWIYRLLFVCLFVVRLRISPPSIKLAASNFARRYTTASKAGNDNFFELCSPRSPKSDESASAPPLLHDLHNDYPLAPEYMSAECGRRIGMCGYTSVPEDGNTC